ncbi:sensor histidine kinase, partial [Acidobacteriota bacterium]
KQTVANKGIKMRYKISEDLPPVMCDSKQVHTAIMDIVSNAVDACLWKEYKGGEFPDIFIQAYSDNRNGHGVLEIRDNGCGMSEAVQSKIFTPFFSTKKKLGTGLGLALTTRIIELHGGSIEVKSEPEKGASFTIILPITNPVNTEEETDAKEGFSDR